MSYKFSASWPLFLSSSRLHPQMFILQALGEKGLDVTLVPHVGDPLPGRSALGSFSGPCEHRGPQGATARPVLATEMRTRNEESPLAPCAFQPGDVQPSRS